MSNIKMIRHTGHCYSVKNQNGFNAALYDYFKESSYSKAEIRGMVENFPQYYPTTIIIIDMSFECRRVYIETIDLNDIAHGTDGIIY